MNTKILLSVILILTLLLGVGFVSATDGDYNHDEKVDMTDTVDKVCDSIINTDNNLNETDTTNTDNQITNTTDNKTNTETSDENYTNPSENLTPKNTNQEKQIKNKVSNDNSQTIYVEELKQYMTHKEIIKYCQEQRNKTKIDLLHYRLLDRRLHAIEIENKYLYNNTDKEDLISCAQLGETWRMSAELGNPCLIYMEIKANIILEGIFGTDLDTLKGKLWDYLFSEKPQPNINQAVNNKANIMNTGINIVKNAWNKIFG